MDDYLSKPFTRDSLVEVLGRYLPGQVPPLELEFARVRPWLRSERWTESTGRPEITA